jgi:cytosine/adenosine deaminase-related metal-dependent hydrolase
MSAGQSGRRSWFARWREHRRAKRQEARERQYFDIEHARSSGTTHSNVSDFAKTSAKSGGWGEG